MMDIGQMYTEDQHNELVKKDQIIVTQLTGLLLRLSPSFRKELAQRFGLDSAAIRTKDPIE